MNKTLLIVICDFLLLSMLGMISFDDLPTKPEPSDDLQVAPYANSQLVDLLKMSLDKERENRQDLSSKVDEYSSRAQEIEAISKEQAAELKKRQEDLALIEKEKLDALNLAEQERLAKEALALENAQRLENAQNLEDKLAQVTQAKLNLEAEAQQKQALEKNFIVAETKLKDTTAKKQELELKVGQLSESDTLLKARLAAMQAELDLAKSKAEDLQKEKAELQNISKELSTQLEVASTKANIYQEDLQKAQVLVLQEKSEKQQIQEHANTLAQGVDKLADSQEKLSKQVEDMRPLSPSEIYENYKANILTVEFKTQRGALIGDGLNTKEFKSAVVDIDGVYWAFMSVKDTPFDRAVDKFYAPDILEITPMAKSKGFRLSTLFYVKGYTNLLAFKVPTAFVEETKIKPYKIATNPFKYTEATIINPNKLYYGQLKYGIDEKYSGIANVDTGFFNAIFGDFSPSTADLVFDRAGNFLGLMTSSSRIALSRNYKVSTTSLSLLDKYNKESAKDFLKAMKSGK